MKQQILESFREIFLPHFTILLGKKITKYPLHLNKASDVGEKLIFTLWNGYVQFCLYIGHKTVRFYGSYCLHPSMWIDLHMYQPKTSLISQSLMVPISLHLLSFHSHYLRPNSSLNVVTWIYTRELGKSVSQRTEELISLWMVSLWSKAPRNLTKVRLDQQEAFPAWRLTTEASFLQQKKLHEIRSSAPGWLTAITWFVSWIIYGY